MPGALVVLLERGMPRADVEGVERGLPRHWRAGPVGSPPGGAGSTRMNFTWENRQAAPWRPAHLRVNDEGGGRRLRWLPRIRLAGDGWEGEPIEVDPQRFRVRVMEREVVRRVWEVEGHEAIYAEAEIESDFAGGLGEGVDVAVAQWGDAFGWGAEATAELI